MKKLIGFLAELLVMASYVVLTCCALCVMNGNKSAAPLGLVCLVVLVTAVIIDERSDK